MENCIGRNLFWLLQDVLAQGHHNPERIKENIPEPIPLGIHIMSVKESLNFVKRSMVSQTWLVPQLMTEKVYKYSFKKIFRCFEISSELEKTVKGTILTFSVAYSHFTQSLTHQWKNQTSNLPQMHLKGHSWPPRACEWHSKWRCQPNGCTSITTHGIQDSLKGHRATIYGYQPTPHFTSWISQILGALIATKVFLCYTFCKPQAVQPHLLVTVPTIVGPRQGTRMKFWTKTKNTD